MKTPVLQWVAAAAVSIAAHAVLFLVLWIAADPDPVEPQSVSEARLDMASYEVDRSRAEPRAPDASAAEEGQASGTSVAGVVVPVSRAKSSPVTGGSALQPTDSKSDSLKPEPAIAPESEALDHSVAALRSARLQAAQAPLRPAKVGASVASSVPLAADVSAAVLAVPAAESMTRVSLEVAKIQTALIEPETMVDVAASASLTLASTGPETTEIERRQIVGIKSASRRPEAQSGARLDPDAAPALQQAAAGFSSRPPATSPEGERAKAALAWSGAGGAPVDPVSMAAIQAFMRPGDIDASASNAGEVRDDIEALLSSVPCARLQTTFVPETGHLELRGHVPEDGVKAPVLAALQAHVGTAIPVADNLLVLPRPQCGALQGVGAVGLPQSTDQLTNPRVVGADAHARVYDFSEGERLEFDLVGADYDAVLYIDYYDADGNVLHLQPNEYLPLEKVEAQSELTIGADRQGKPSLEIIVAPPFGQEIMVAMATSQPLYEGLRPIMEPAEPYLAFMREQVAEARVRQADFKGEWVYFFVRTAPR